ncbi:MAG: hypothetical protein JXD18_01330 [Anaerolineae bacterium]|nr:hypothetical protein [Anaerolineae bacterium]
MRTELFTIDHLRPKFLENSERFNDWYFTVHFKHEGKPVLAKFSLTEGSLLGQATHLSFSQAPLDLREEPDALVMKPSSADLSVHPNADFSFAAVEDEVRIEMGDLIAICRADEQRLISKNEQLSADLTFRPRGPILFWNHEPGAECEVTDVTRVSGSESLSEVTGSVTVQGQKMDVQGRGLFERVWFKALNFFEIRWMNWIYAHFDNAYLYLCHCESTTSENQPFHFETGDVYLELEDDLLAGTSLEVMPETWVFFEQVRRFIPLEQSVVMRTDKGTLKLNVRLAHYPQMAQDPARLEGLTINNIPGWGSLFYDGPVTLKGKFTYKDGRVVELVDGVGINEVIRIAPL